MTIPCDPDAVDTEVRLAEHQSMAGHVGKRLAGLARLPARSVTCLYTTTSDHDFLVDTHPLSDAIRVVSACSGHGFKHAAAMGEAIASEWAGEAGELSLAPFSRARFAAS